MIRFWKKTIAILRFIFVWTESSPRTKTIYRLMYWSTRKEAEIWNPYGTSDYEDRRAVRIAKKNIEWNADVYKTEVWKLTELMEREKIVEKYHGNPAHLNLKNSRWETF